MTQKFSRRQLLTAATGAPIAAAATMPAQNPGASEQATPGARLYPQTSVESAAGVVPATYVHPPGNVLRYGADPTGVADCSSAFNHAAACGAGLISLPAGTYRIAATVSLDISKIGMRGTNATVLSGLGSPGNLFRIGSGQGAEAATKNSIEGIEFIGTNVAGVVCFDLNQTAGGYVAGFSFRSCTFNAFQTFLQFRQNAFEVNFDGCTFSQQLGAVGGIYIPRNFVNFGERISFSNCAFFNNALCINCAWNAATLFFSNSSFDYCNQVITISAGAALFQHCYFENNLDSAYWYQTTGDCMMTFDHCFMSQTGPKPRFNWASSAASNIGAIVIRNCVLYSSSNAIVAANPFLVAAGTSFGFAYGSNNRMMGFNPTTEGWAGISASSGLQPSLNAGLPGFIHGSSGAGGNPSLLGGAGPRGGNAMGLQVAADGQDQFIYFPARCQAGDNVGVSFQAKSNYVAAPFACKLLAYDAAEVQLASSALIGGFNSWDGVTHKLATAFAPYRTLFANVPAGTATIRVQFMTSGPTKTAYQIVIGDLGIFKY